MLKFREYFRGVAQRDEFLPALPVLTAAALWLPGAASSLWRDEAATFWIIKDSWAAAFERATTFQEWSPAYFLPLKAWISIFGKSELALRAPSLAAAAVSAYALYLLGKRLKDGETGLLAALAFAASETAAFHAADARPYAIALAFGILSTLNIVALLDENKTKNLAAYVLFSALAVYSHITFAALPAAHALYCGFRYYRERRPAAKIVSAHALLVLLLLPLAGPAGRILDRASSLMFARIPTAADLLHAAVPLPLAIGLAAGLLTAGGFRSRLEKLRSFPVQALVLAAGLAFLPPLAFFLVCRFAAAKIWVARYFFYSQAGAALCAGILLRTLEPWQTRRVAAAAVAAAALLSCGRLAHVNEDWRAAAQWAGARAELLGVPVILASPYVEANQPGWPSDPGRSGYLSAPLAYYPVGARIFTLPEIPGANAESYLLDGIKTGARGEAGFLFMAAGGKEYDEWMSRRCRENKFVRTEFKLHGGVSSAVFLPRGSPGKSVFNKPSVRTPKFGSN